MRFFRFAFAAGPFRRVAKAAFLSVLALSAIWVAIVFLPLASKPRWLLTADWIPGNGAPRKKVYRIGYNQNPPFNYRKSPESGPAGFAVETVQLAARRAGIELEWVFDASMSGDMLQRGEVDLWPIFADLPERRNVVYISDPWVVSENFLLVQGKREISIDRPMPVPVYFTGPDLYRRMIRRYWPQAELRRVEGPLAFWEPFCRGDMEVAFLASHATALTLRELQRQCPDVEARAVHLPELRTRLGVGSRLEHAGVAHRLYAEILAMGESGDLGSILAQYAYVGLTEMRTILQMVEAERQSHRLELALIGLAATIPVLVWLLWRLRRARQAAEQASLAKSQFLANMSHEIRTPLGGVIGMIQLALETSDGPALPPARREYLETANASAHTLLTILNDILDFSKIEARRLDLSPQPVDPRKLLAEVAGLMSPVAQRKGLRLTSGVDADVPASIEADPVRVKQVLLNLCGNSVKFTVAGSVELRLRRASAAQLRFEVRDTGIGVPPGKLESIFHPFEQADGAITRNFGGTGLGLSISKQLVELMGGGITAESVVGQGSTFAFTLPLMEAARPVPVAVTAPPVELSGPMRLLVAEDNPVNQKLICALLKRDGHAVDLVSSGKAALAALGDADAVGISAHRRYDAVLMDIQMPEMDGLQATRAIRALPSLNPMRDIPVIALTAHAHAGYDAVCREAGMNGYVTKPVDQDALRRALAQAAQWTPVAL